MKIYFRCTSSLIYITVLAQQLVMKLIVNWQYCGHLGIKKFIEILCHGIWSIIVTYCS